MKQTLRICHLYPDLLNTNGDRGNIIALMYRAGLRGLAGEICSLTVGAPFKAEQYDIVFLGGGQHAERDMIRKDFMDAKGDAIKEAVENGNIFLCICGGYQLMGRFYPDKEGREVEGLGAINVHTIFKPKRLLGDTVYQCDFLEASPALNLYEPQKLYGFENHEARTYLGEGVAPLASVISGGGNNGEDKTEGAVYRGVYCSYSHGSLLPKNPALTDYLIEKALKNKFGAHYILPVASCEIENIARKQVDCKR